MCRGDSRSQGVLSGQCGWGTRGAQELDGIKPNDGVEESKVKDQDAELYPAGR